MIDNKNPLFSAQSMGLLSEPHSEEADHADPFYAHCKVHSDKTMLKHRKRNYNALQVRLEQKTLEHEAKRMEVDPSAEQQRVERKLKKHKKKYLANKAVKVEPWGELLSTINNKNKNYIFSDYSIVFFNDNNFVSINALQFPPKRCPD